MNDLMNRLNLMDCMDGMSQFPDKYFELAIVDPPYGIGRFGNRFKGNDKLNKWDIKPGEKYFIGLQRISKNQIVWGANNFTLPETEYFIIWDKMQTVDNFASAEYAWTNVKNPAKVFRFSIHKHNQIDKIHPTQKPVNLYRWLLQNYAKKGDKILDTHVGSGSSIIACMEEGFNFCGFEIDEDYYNAAQKRIKEFSDQLRLFVTA